MWAEYRKNKEYSDISCACMMIEFLSLYSRNRDKTPTNPIEIKIKKIINELHYYFNNNKYIELDIDAVIKNYNLSKSHFYRLFKKYTGTTPLGFITSLRMTAAADYLTLYNFKINEISKKLGFEDSLYFSRAFKKVFGMSPKKYRELNKIHKNIQEEGDVKKFQTAKKE